MHFMFDFVACVCDQWVSCGYFEGSWGVLCCLFKDYLDSDQNEQYNNEILVLRVTQLQFFTAALAKPYCCGIGHSLRQYTDCCFGFVHLWIYWSNNPVDHWYSLVDVRRVWCLWWTSGTVFENFYQTAEELNASTLMNYCAEIIAKSLGECEAEEYGGKRHLCWKPGDQERGTWFHRKLPLWPLVSFYNKIKG